MVLNLPEGCVVKFSNNTRRYLNHNMASNYVNHYLNVVEDGIECNDCEDDEFDVDVDIPNIKIDENGIEIKADKSSLKINDKGINAESEEVKVKIDSDGINIKSDK